jgi:uncharacterized protein (DUF1810 family)
MADPFNLNRFLEAQNPVYERVLSELRRGQQGLGSAKWRVGFPSLRSQRRGAIFEDRRFGLRKSKCRTLP